MFSSSVDSSCAGRAISIVLQEPNAGWSFDPVSFCVGLVVAFLLIGLAYRFRGHFARLWNRINENAKRLRERLTASMSARYSVNAIESAQTMHLFGSLASLDDIYVETRLDVPLASPLGTFERPSLSPQQAIRAGNRLVILGRPGSGRTTMLNHLLRYQASIVQTSGESAWVPAYVYLPLLARELAAMKHTRAKDNRQIAPAQQLVQLALSPMSRLEASRVARWLRSEVETGNALLLLDGWDEVPVADRPTVTAWIRRIGDTCRQNRLVVTAGERGYAPLIEAGFVPLRLSIWTDRHLDDLARRWSEVEPFKEDDQDVEPLEIPYSLTPPSPLEATLECVIRLQGQVPSDTPAGKMNQVLDLLLPPPESDDAGRAAWPQETGHRALGRLAVTATEQGRITLEREEIQSAVSSAMPPPQFALGEEHEGAVTRQMLNAEREEQERRALQIVDCCRDLTAPGAPIRSWGNEQHFFSHPLVAAYLAARYLANQNLHVVNHADDAAWFDVLRFYVGLAPAGRLIGRLLSIPDDALLSYLWTAATVMAAARPGDAPSRVALLTRLAQLFLNPRIPELFRERCLVALVQSREAGVRLLFKQAASNPDDALRARAILGLAALGHEQDLETVAAGLGDASPEVQIAAVDALAILGRKGDTHAFELVVTALVEADDQVQRVAAEALAELGLEGYAVLRDATKDEDLMVRRASVYGLVAIGEPWAREMLDRMQHEDNEWLARNAAAEALARVDQWDDPDAPPVALTLPQAESEPWLIAWTAERGEGTGVGDAALSAVLTALAEGDASTRDMALGTLGRLADPRTIDVLCQTLRDPDPLARDAALVALDEISHRHDMTIAVS